MGGHVGTTGLPIRHPQGHGHELYGGAQRILQPMSFASGAISGLLLGKAECLSNTLVQLYGNPNDRSRPGGYNLGCNWGQLPTLALENVIQCRLCKTLSSRYEKSGYGRERSQGPGPVFATENLDTESLAEYKRLQAAGEYTKQNEIPPPIMARQFQL